MLLPVAAAVIGACSIFVHPYGDVKHQASDVALINDAMVDTAVRKLVGNSCKNCHSESTEWPWYSYVAPMSWLIEGDVYHARSHMNLSRWDDYSVERKQALLSDSGLQGRVQVLDFRFTSGIHPVRLI